jgi:hypothetical protein
MFQKKDFHVSDCPSQNSNSQWLLPLYPAETEKLDDGSWEYTPQLASFIRNTEDPDIFGMGTTVEKPDTPASMGDGSKFWSGQ